MSAFQPFLQHFAAASDTVSDQDYEALFGVISFVSLNLY